MVSFFPAVVYKFLQYIPVNHLLTPGFVRATRALENINACMDQHHVCHASIPFKLCTYLARCVRRRTYSNSTRTGADAHRTCLYPPTSAWWMLWLVIMELDRRVRIMPSVFVNCGSYSAQSTLVLDSEPLMAPSTVASLSLAHSITSDTKREQPLDHPPSQPLSSAALHRWSPGFDSSEQSK